MPPESEFPLQSLTAARVVVVAGKGGVGKTTVTAVIARAASDVGRRVLVVELDGKPALADLLPDVEVLAISAPDALDEYLRDHGFARIAKRLNRTPRANGFFVPLDVQVRDMTAAGVSGSNYLVSTDNQPANFIELARARSITQTMGATRLPALTYDL